MSQFDDEEQILKYCGPVWIKDRKQIPVKPEVKEEKKPRKRYDSSVPDKYKRYVSSANARGLRFELTVQEFNEICALPCTYCGARSNIGVDRADSTAGYFVENCTPCCSTCNTMKWRLSQEQFYHHIKQIYFHLKR